MPASRPYQLIEYLAAWIVLAQEGLCDGHGGREYYRVRAEWIDAGRPEPAGFIRRAANRPPTAPSAEE